MINAAVLAWLAAWSQVRACEGAGCANGLVYEAFGPAPGAGRPLLAVFIHGDVSAGGPADYMVAHARQFAASRKNVVAIALLRPGYYDRGGRQSASWLLPRCSCRLSRGRASRQSTSTQPQRRS